MKKTVEQILEEFQKELKENDKKVQEDINKKTDEEKAKEFAMFIKKNKCKVVGGKNGK
ncbi:MAG: hypothetical protein J6Q13_01195 [Clostridia bacterium]|nr:hypothetical protein [Clostridia bacterium]